jgi:membrane associated rhomboid family serine protease
MFMHGGLGHLFFNMFAVFMFGRVLETVWGSKRFFIFYILTGIGAAVAHLTVNYFQAQKLIAQIAPEQVDYIIQNGYSLIKSGQNFSNEILGRLNLIYNIPTVGASGAVFGVLIAFAMLFPNTELMFIFIPVPIKAKYIIPAYAVLELFFGVANFKGDNIAHFAHLGGAFVGFIIVKIWNANRKTFY